jgi:hypothetical protein
MFVFVNLVLRPIDTQYDFVLLSFISPKGPDCRMNRVLSNSAQQHHHQQQAAAGILTNENQQDQFYNCTQDTSSPRSITSRSDSTAGEHSFLESHIASISQWLTANAV